MLKEKRSRKEEDSSISVTYIYGVSSFSPLPLHFISHLSLSLSLVFPFLWHFFIPIELLWFQCWPTFEPLNQLSHITSGYSIREGRKEERKRDRVRERTKERRRRNTVGRSNFLPSNFSRIFVIFGKKRKRREIGEK